MRLFATLALMMTLLLEGALPARAWGAVGHRIINGDAARALPDTVPAFVRTPDAIAEIAVLGPEADRLKGAGTAWDSDYDPGHFIDLNDDGTVDGIIPLAALPPTREAYDTALRAGAAFGGKPPDQYRLGYLPYSILEGWQQIVQDFGIWRVDTYGEAHAADPAARAAFAADRALREVLTVRDIGYWGHFVGDASQPLHVSIHYNGWGSGPNPNNYTQSTTIHADFETTFVNAHATPELVQSRMAAYVPSAQPMPARIAAYLQATLAGVPAVYQFYGAGAFTAATPQAVGFMLDRLAAAAQFMRDAVADAYVASEDAKISYPSVRVRDVESGAAAPPSPRIEN